MDESDSLVIEIGARIGEFAKSLNDANGVAAKAFASIEARGDAASKHLDTSFAKVGSSPSLTLLSKGLLTAEANAGKLVSRLQQAKATIDATKTTALSSFATGQSTSGLALLQQVQAAGSLKAFAAASGGALGVGALVAGIAATETKKLADLKAAADDARVTAAEFAGLQSVLGKIGFSSDEAGKLIGTFADKLLNAKAYGGALKEALDAAGIAFTNADGTLRPTIDVLSDVAKFMRSSTDEAAKLRLAAAGVGDELGGRFVSAVEKGSVSLDNLAAASHKVGLSMVNDLSSAAAIAVNAVEGLIGKIDQYYARLKQIAHFAPDGNDAVKIARLNLDEAISARDMMTRRFEDSPGHFNTPDGKAPAIDPAELRKANEKVFAAAAELQKVDKISVLQGGDPREQKAPAPASPAPAIAGEDADKPKRAGRGARSTESDDKAPEVIANLRLQLQLASATGDAHQRIADEIKIANELKRAGVEADSAEGKIIADLVRATDAATAAAKVHNQVLAARKETVDLIGSSLESSLEGVLLHGAKLTTIFSSLAETLARAALQGALLGQGPLAGLLGGSTAATGTSAGGLLGSLAHLAGFAEGGQIAGPGTGTSDSILARLSHGEFIVNAKATKASLPLLTAINEGKMPRYASGGQVGATTAPVISMSGSSPIAVTNHVELHASGGTPAQNADMAKQVSKQLDVMVRSTIADELRRQMRSGNMLNRP